MDDLDSLLTWTVIRAGRQWEHALTAVLAEFDLTPVQFGVMAQLSAHPALTQAELARRVMMRPQSMNHLLDTLTGRGLVQRRADRGSGRPNPVTLSAQGAELLARVWPTVREVNDPRRLGLDAADVGTVATALRTILSAADQHLASSGR